jgi:hypothetical protein
VLVFVAVITAPGSTAPEASEIVPLGLALLDRVNALMGTLSETNAATITRSILFIFPPFRVSSGIQSKHRSLRAGTLGNGPFPPSLTTGSIRSIEPTVLISEKKPPTH